MRWPALLLALSVGGAWAGEPLPAGEAASWLQRMADAARQQAYEGVFILGQGSKMLTFRVANRPAGGGKESRLVLLDGQEREIRCSRGGSIGLVGRGADRQWERRPSSRHFPDLLPENAAELARWYGVRLGEVTRVGGLDCREVALVPKDQYRWGYTLCAAEGSYLPLKAVMNNEDGVPLMQYAFAEVRLGRAGAPQARPVTPPADIQPLQVESVQARQLPPGFSRVMTMKRKLPNHPVEVEHSVFSDGLTHVSMFVEASAKPAGSMRGESPGGMMNLMTRQVGGYQVTVVGEAPRATVEAIARNLVERAP